MAEGYFSSVNGEIINSSSWNVINSYNATYNTKEEALRDGIIGEYKYRREDNELYERESRVYLQDAESYGYVTTLVRIHENEGGETTLQTLGVLMRMPAENAIIDIVTGLGMKLNQASYYNSIRSVEDELKDYIQDGAYPVVITAEKIFCYLDEMIEKVRRYFTNQETNTAIECPYDYTQQVYTEGQGTLVAWDNKKLPEVVAAFSFDDYQTGETNYEYIYNTLKEKAESDEELKAILQCPIVRIGFKSPPSPNYFQLNIAGYEIDNNTIVTTTDSGNNQHYSALVTSIKYKAYQSYTGDSDYPAWHVRSSGSSSYSSTQVFYNVAAPRSLSDFGMVTGSSVVFYDKVIDSIGFVGNIKPYEVLPNATPINRTAPDLDSNYPGWNPIINILRPITVNSVVQDWHGIPDINITYNLPPIINRPVVIVYNITGPSTDIELPHTKDYGLFTIYVPDDDEGMLEEITGKLWKPSILERIEKIFKNNPLDAVISLHEVYFDHETLQGLRSGNTPKIVYFGNVEMTDAAYEWTKQRYVEFSMGALNLPRTYSDYRDFEREISIYLPFIGFNTLNTYDLVGSTTTVIEPKYVCDILTGECICNIYVWKDGARREDGSTADYKLMYTFTGNVSSALPLSANDRSRLFNGSIGAIGNIATALLTGGKSQIISSVIGGGASLATSGQSSINRSGSISGNNGAMNFKRAYLIINNPKPLDVTYNDLAGYTTNLKARLNTLTGFTKIRECHVDTIPNASDQEKSMIDSLLKKGIIL